MLAVLLASLISQVSPDNWLVDRLPRDTALCVRSRGLEEWARGAESAALSRMIGDPDIQDFLGTLVPDIEAWLDTTREGEQRELFALTDPLWRPWALALAPPGVDGSRSWAAAFDLKTDIDSNAALHDLSALFGDAVQESEDRAHDHETWISSDRLLAAAAVGRLLVVASDERHLAALLSTEGEGLGASALYQDAMHPHEGALLDVYVSREWLEAQRLGWIFESPLFLASGFGQVHALSYSTRTKEGRSFDTLHVVADVATPRPRAVSQMEAPAQGTVRGHGVLNASILDLVTNVGGLHPMVAGFLGDRELRTSLAGTWRLEVALGVAQTFLVELDLKDPVLAEARRTALLPAGAQIDVRDERDAPYWFARQPLSIAFPTQPSWAQLDDVLILGSQPSVVRAKMQSIIRGRTQTVPAPTPSDAVRLARLEFDVKTTIPAVYWLLVLPALQSLPGVDEVFDLDAAPDAALLQSLLNDISLEVLQTETGLTLISSCDLNPGILVVAFGRLVDHVGKTGAFETAYSWARVSSLDQREGSSRDLFSRFTNSLFDAIGGFFTSEPRLAPWSVRAARACVWTLRTFTGESSLTALWERNLGHALFEQAEFEEAIEVFEASDRLHARDREPDDLLRLEIRHMIGRAHRAIGNAEIAARIHRNVAELALESLGPDDWRVADYLNELAVALSDFGRFAEARVVIERVVEIRSKLFGPEGIGTIHALANLASTLVAADNYHEAEPISERVVELLERVGPDSSDLAHGLHTLGNIHSNFGRATESVAAMERALRILENAGKSQARYAMVILNDLSVAHELSGDMESSRAVQVRLLEMHEAHLSPNHRWRATGLLRLASFASHDGDHEEALRLVERARGPLEDELGEGHATVTSLRVQISATYTALGNLKEAWRWSRSAARSATTRIESPLWHKSEWEAIGTSERSFLDLSVSLASRIETKEAHRTAYQDLLAWKGSVSRGLLRGRHRLIENLTVEQEVIFGKLRACQTRLSTAVSSSASGEKLSRLREERGRLERELSDAIGHRDDASSVELTDVRSALPDGSALVDFLVYNRLRAEAPRNAAWRVAAWVLRSDTDEPIRVELGPASTLRTLVDEHHRAMRAAVASRGESVPIASPPTSVPGRELAIRLWSPVAEHLEGADLVFISPDQFLGAVPFGALVDADGRFLIETRRFAYLQDAGTLVGLTRGPDPGETPESSLLLVGDVAYDAKSSSAAGTPNRLKFADTRGYFKGDWAALPYTRDEVTAIAAVHTELGGPPALVLSGSSATETAVKRALPNSNYVHLATHGFYAPDRTHAPGRLGETELAHAEESRIAALMPGLYTGIVCSGANRSPEPDRDNGLLTAEEVAWLDLRSCELVVLSACRTGLGKESRGEGLLGLRRAMQMAGARSVVSSLWSIEDKATSALMTAFYRRLWIQGESRLDALRGAQLELLREGPSGRGLPFYWAAFVLDGEWR